MESYSKIRISVRSICINNGRILFQTDVNDKNSIFATVGGEVEPGEKLEERLILEYKEETGMDIEVMKYLFVIENFLVYNGKSVHSLEHYFLVEIKSTEFSSLEPHLSFHWIDLEEIKNYEVRPKVLKDLLINGDFEKIRHLIEKSL